MIALTSSTTFTRHPDLVCTDMDGDTVMMSIERGEYFGIGGVGPKVWALLAQPASIAQLTEAICDEYEVDPSTCEVDLQMFLDELLKRGLVSTA